MPVVLCRVDERLVHGQVVLGWGTKVRPDRYVVVDDDLARAQWEQDLYRLSLPDGTAAEFVSPADAAVRFAEWDTSASRTIVLLRGLNDVLELARLGVLEGRTLNLGGLHYAPGRKQVLSFLHLEQDDLDRIRWLDEQGVTVVAQELPGSPKWGAGDLVRRGARLWSD